MFIRPAASESDFDLDEDFCGISDEESDESVSLHLALPLIPHPSSNLAAGATAEEAHTFWRDGGWDE